MLPGSLGSPSITPNDSLRNCLEAPGWPRAWSQEDPGWLKGDSFMMLWGALGSPRSASAPSTHTYCTARAFGAVSRGTVGTAECGDGPRVTQSEDFTGFHNIKDLTVNDTQEAVKQTFPLSNPTKKS